MSSNWSQNHTRYHLIQSLIVRDDVSLDNVRDPAVLAEFPEKSDLVRALHQRWVTILEGCLDVAMETGDGDGGADVRTAYKQAFGHSPQLRRLLDREANDPVLSRLTEHEHLKMAQAAGLMRPGRHVSDVIAEVADLVTDVTPAAIVAGTRGWFSRLTARVAS